MDRSNVNPKKKYVVSSLKGGASGQQPMVAPRIGHGLGESKSRAEDIFIPSVSLTVDQHGDNDSPRSLGSNASQLSFFSADMGKGAHKEFSESFFNAISVPEVPLLEPEIDATGVPHAMRGYRHRVKPAEVVELRTRLSIGQSLSPHYNSGAMSPLNDEYSVGSGIDDPKHFSSGVSVILFPNKRTQQRSTYWGSGRSTEDHKHSALWGEDSYEDRPGSTLEARELALERERKRKQIDAITESLREPPRSTRMDSSFHTAPPHSGPDDGNESDDELSLQGHDLVGAYLSVVKDSNAAEQEMGDKSKLYSELGPEPEAELEDVHGLRAIDTDLLVSKTRQNLMNLGKYVHGHTNRKIMIAWTSIESRFQKSLAKKVEMVKDENGLTHPVKRSALYLSALTGMLCSTSIRCTYKELNTLYHNFGCTAKDVFKSRKLAAIKAVLGPTNGQGLRQKDELLADMNILMAEEEPLISLEQLLTAVFPEDPVERKKELDSLEAEKAVYIVQMLEEKNKRESMAAAIATRKEKMLSDFDESVREIQFAKGPVMFNKLRALKDLIVYCGASYDKAHAETDVKVSDELTALLGVEAFPDCVRRGILEAQQRMREEHAKYAYIPGQKKPEIKAPVVHEVIKIGKATVEEMKDTNEMPKITRIGYTGQFRVLIHSPFSHNPLSLVPLIREVVSYGKGLNGLAYRDVVEMVQAYSSTRLQARFRCFKRRWRYTAARIKWKGIFKVTKTKFFKSWAIFIRHVYDTRNFCWRKLIAWHQYTINAKKRREHFRINFWPFYVWHRYAAASRTATEKARFLVNRVVPTLGMLRVYKAWKKYYMEEKHMRDTADDFKDMVLRYRARILLAWHRRWTRRRIKIRKNWYKKGMITFKRKLFVCKLTPFLVWKMIWFYKRLLHNRLVVYAPAYRSNMMQERPIKKMPLLGEIKAKAKEVYEANGGDTKREAELKARKRAAKKKKKGGASVDGDDAGDDASSQVSAGGSVASRKLMKPFFYIKGPRYCGTDMDSDAEEAEFTPARMTEIYQEKIPEMVSPSELEFLTEADDFIFEKILILAKRYTIVDNWNMCEWSMRYHMRIHRAFKNLRQFAKVSKSARKSQSVHAKKMKRKCFMALLGWMLRDPAAINLADQTDAEKVYADAKVYRMDKMMKWRGIATQIKVEFGRDEEEEDVIGELESPSQAVIWARKQRKKEREEKRLTDIENGLAVFETPNFLDWDRQDREVELQQSELMLKISKEVKAKALELSKIADRETEIFEKQEMQVDNIVTQVFQAEDKDSNKAIGLEMEYVDKFKIHAADNLVNVMHKIYKEVQVFLLKSETKKYFRALRMPMITQRSYAMCNRKKMTNWIRICRRLSSLSEKAPVYYQRRKTWIVFNRWLKLLERESLNCSSGFVSFIKHHMELYPKFSNRLKANGIIKTVYTNSKPLLKAASDISSVFYRWLMTVVEEKLFRTMQKKADELYRFRLLNKVFWSMRTLMTPEETYEFRESALPFRIIRARSDLDQLTKRFIAKRKKNYQIVICSYNRRYICFSMREARRAASFKSFCAFFKVFVTRRLIREQRILVDAFDLRGTQQYMDICCPNQKDPIMPRKMARLEGKVFRDPHPLNGEQFSSLLPVLPGGFRISKIRISHQDVNGTVEASVTGWQLVWGADGVADVEGPKRGKWKGAAMTVIEFVVPKDDFVMGIEYLYEGANILGIRIKCFLSGFGRWLGARPSVTAVLTVYLGCELAPKQTFEDEYTSPGRDETENPAMPRSFVIGFTGLDYNPGPGGSNKASAMGIIVRKIKDQHIFSYTWVNEALSRKGHGNGSELRVIGADKEGLQKAVNDDMSLDIQSFPSNVDTGKLGFQFGDVSVSEDITVSINHLPPVPGATPANPESSLDDASSLGPGSVTFAEDGEGKESVAAEEEEEVENGKEENVPTLTPSEEQFFDLLRMRNMEVITAQNRAESFARRLWSARLLRNDPVLSKLTTVKIIAPLTKWYFQAICKRLVNATDTEAEGEELLEDARLKRLQVDKLTRRSVAEFLRRDEYVRSQSAQAWFGLQIMSPAQRQAKRVYLDSIKTLAHDAAESREKAKNLMLELVEDEKRGKMLLPRVQLSVFVCRNFKLKLSAARHKETLLERMDMDEIKRALSGGDAKVSELSDVSMEIIRSTLAGKKAGGPNVFTLDKLIATEMAKAKAKEKKKLALQMPTSSGSAVRPISSGLSTDARTRSKDEPMYLKSHGAYKEALGGVSYRKSNAINPLNALSSSNVDVKLGAIVGERKLMSSSSATFLQNNKNPPKEGRIKKNLRDRILSKSLDMTAIKSDSVDLADRILGSLNEMSNLSLTSTD